MGCAWSPFLDFEICPNIVVGLDEISIQLIIKQYKSFFITYELCAGVYSIKGYSEVVYTMSDYRGTQYYEYDGISMKTKII